MQENGLSGLKNLGNTCFINSTLQVLSHTPELNNLFDKDIKLKVKSNIEATLFKEWKELFILLWNKNCVISPNKFLNTLQMVSKKKDNDLFSGFDQNDLPEFLIFIIDCFHNSLSREITMTITGKIENETDKTAVKCYETIKNMYSKDYSEIWSLFYAIQITELKSIKTGKTLSLVPEPFFILNLSIPPKKSPSLIDCFNYFAEDEILENENAWLNEETNEKESITKRNTFWSLPNILVIDLKRYNNSNRKNQQLIDFPLENLDLSPFVTGYKKDEYKYDLYGVCNHSGNVLGGHYTSYVKTKKNNWYLFNDTLVTKVTTPQSIVSPKAYCLFYRKKRIV
jgi:ubiquitin carboxyl-terminal hydrolase 8